MKEIKENIESRFQILITLSIFFPVLLYNLGKVAGDTDTGATITTLRVGALIGLTLIDYIIFQGAKNDFSQRSLKRINKALLWSIGFFIIPILGLALATYKINLPSWANNLLGWTFGTSILVVLAIPVAIELILLILSIRSDLKEKKANKKRRV